jgi:hypothetical protein
MNVSFALCSLLVYLLQLELCVFCSSRNSSAPHRLRVNDIENLSESGFDPKNPTKILIHGFGGNGQSSSITESKGGRYGILL